MNVRLDYLRDDVLSAWAREPSAIAAALIDSLKHDNESAIAAAWRIDLLARREALRVGQIEPIGWAEAQARLSVS